MPRLENWSIGGSNPYQAPELQSKRLYGEIYDDEKGRFPDGSTISTSSLEELNLEENYAMTRNTKYILGKPDVKYVEWLDTQKTFKDLIK